MIRFIFLSANGEYSITGDTYVLDIPTVSWIKVHPDGSHPPPRAAHAACCVDFNQMVIYGGATGGGSLSSDDLILLDYRDVESATWLTVPVVGTTPGRRYGHTMAFHKPNIILYGGNIGSMCQSDIWVLDVDRTPFTWKEVPLSSNTPRPPARVYHTADICLDGPASGMMVVFGGRTHENKHLGDLWGLRQHRNGQWDWIEAPTRRGTPAAPRCQHSASFIGHRLVITGGRSEAVFQRLATSIYSTTCCDWYTGPTISRFRHSSWGLDSILFCFGGFDHSSAASPTDTLQVLEIRNTSKEADGKSTANANGSLALGGGAPSSPPNNNASNNSANNTSSPAIVANVGNGSPITSSIPSSSAPANLQPLITSAATDGATGGREGPSRVSAPPPQFSSATSPEVRAAANSSSVPDTNARANTSANNNNSTSSNVNNTSAISATNDLARRNPIGANGGIPTSMAPPRVQTPNITSVNAAIGEIPPFASREVRLANQVVVSVDNQFSTLVQRICLDQLEDEGKKLKPGSKTHVELVNLVEHDLDDDTLPNKFIRALLKPTMAGASSVTDPWAPAPDRFALPWNDVASLCDMTLELMKTQPSLMRLRAPIKVYGDIHGQYGDLMRMFSEYKGPWEGEGGDIETTEYLFLGDYVDRGAYSLETICLLFALKLKYPGQVHLIRGNHEDPHINALYGFQSECRRRLQEDVTLPNSVWARCNAVFEWLPLGALIEDKILCIHGGIGGTIHRLEDISSIQRPLKVDQTPLTTAHQKITDLLWSDPTDHDGHEGIYLNETRDPEGTGRIYKFGPDRVHEFLNNNKLSMIIRAHECVMDGFERFAGGKLITLFSATDYCSAHKNAGALLFVRRDCTVVPKIIYPTERKLPQWDSANIEARPPTPPRPVARRPPLGQQVTSMAYPQLDKGRFDF